MALGKTYIMGLVKKAPTPDKLDAMGDMAGDDKEESDETPKDEDGEEAAKASAFDDFLTAIGVSPAKADKARAAFDEYMGLCK
jgi:hypothetical protein